MKTGGQDEQSTVTRLQQQFTRMGGNGKNVYCQRVQPVHKQKADADSAEFISLNRRKGHVQSQEQVNMGQKGQTCFFFQVLSSPGIFCLSLQSQCLVLNNNVQKRSVLLHGNTSTYDPSTRRQRRGIPGGFLASQPNLTDKLHSK